MTNARGEIISFYAYKGGSGRSTALANVGWILASNGLRVLMIDWDLEAPGVHRYFLPLIDESCYARSPGMLDLIEDTMAAIVANPELPGESILEELNLLSYLQSVIWDFGNGYLEFISAGRPDSAYAARVNTLSWETFYQKLNGAAFLDAFKDWLRSQYDYVLIDSRTGLADVNGITTVHMPDSVVACFTLNTQSMSGTANVADSIVRLHSNSSVRIFPVPMRVERAEKAVLDYRMESAVERFDKFLGHLPPAERRRYWQEVMFYYTPFYATNEVPAVFADRSGQVDSLLASAERLTAFLTSGRVTKAAPIDDVKRAESLRRYQQPAGELPLA
jgi:MinD-like ATPase involved in chromosome partitioning or flagellar assembly